MLMHMSKLESKNIATWPENVTVNRDRQMGQGALQRCVKKADAYKFLRSRFHLMLFYMLILGGIVCVLGPVCVSVVLYCREGCVCVKSGYVGNCLRGGMCGYCKWVVFVLCLYNVYCM